MGQYNNTEEIFGVCFAAALIKKDAFNKEKVGAIDKSFFAYYEDVDWCLRANLLGYKFLSAPKAVVYHFHSGCWREKPYATKYRLIERNLLRTAFKNFQIKNVIRTYMRRWCNNIEATFFKNGFRIVSLQILILSLVSIPRLIIKRIGIQKRRKINDFQIFKYSRGERPHYNPIKYEPTYSLDALADIYKRLYIISGNQEYHNICTFIEEVNSSKFRFELDRVRERLKILLKDEPGAILDFVDKLKAE
jgi:hypothetical protein